MEYKTLRLRIRHGKPMTIYGVTFTLKFDDVEPKERKTGRCRNRGTAGRRAIIVATVPVNLAADDLDKSATATQNDVS